MFDPKLWAAVPFHFWSLVFFVFGCIVGSFLNVCIHRMPRGESIVSPPSHCPHCDYSIPWYLNIPLVTWVYLGGKCAHCAAPISPRYFLVELLTGIAFLGSWLAHGSQPVLWAVAMCLFLSGLIVATFIDFEHFIIPDEITIGGMVVGFAASLAVPQLHDTSSRATALLQSGAGMIVGGGVVYGVLRFGKLLFGRLRMELAPDSRVVFTETALKLPNEEIPYEEIFYRKSDTITLNARTLELVDRCYAATTVRLSPERLEIGDEVLDPEAVHHMEAVTDCVVRPREAMGFGDVKFMAAIGAFLGWKATVFSLLASSMIGAVAGLLLILLRKQEWSSRIPYGPYIALAAVIWVFGGHRLLSWWFAPWG
jgi:leader peptidase (prepilin peptidase)/N-methyltransferase